MRPGDDLSYTAPKLYGSPDNVEAPDAVSFAGDENTPLSVVSSSADKPGGRSMVVEIPEIEEKEEELGGSAATR